MTRLPAARCDDGAREVARAGEKYDLVERVRETSSPSGQKQYVAMILVFFRAALRVDEVDNPPQSASGPAARNCSLLNRLMTQLTPAAHSPSTVAAGSSTV